MKPYNLSAARMIRFVTILVCICLALTASAPSWAGAAARLQNPFVMGAAVNGVIGGYRATIHEAALAVEANGRMHVLWAGTTNPHFERFIFYSTSTDGTTWSPYQVLNSWVGYDPRIVVDDAHQLVHLIYRSNYDGLIHHTVRDGVVSQGVVVDAACGVDPQAAVDEQTGILYLVCHQGHTVVVGDVYYWRYRTWHYYWDGVNWSGPQKVTNDTDTSNASVAVAPGGREMLAWFQRWTQSAGGAVDPGEQTVPRTAYGTQPDNFPLRLAVSEEYPMPEKDNSISLIYSPGDDAFVMICYHLMWPGHSRVYRYLWMDDGSVAEDGLPSAEWSAALDVSQNIEGWASPSYVGAAANQALIYYVYSDDGEVQMRTESKGVLSAPRKVADELAARGCSNCSPLAYFVDKIGRMHIVANGAKDGVQGFHYLAP